MEREGSVFLPRLAGQKPALAPDSTKNFYPLCTSEMSTVMLPKKNLCYWMASVFISLSIFSEHYVWGFPFVSLKKEKKKLFKSWKVGLEKILNFELCTRTLIWAHSLDCCDPQPREIPKYRSKGKYMLHDWTKSDPSLSEKFTWGLSGSVINIWLYITACASYE